MKTIYMMILILIFLQTNYLTQTNDYWKDAPTEGTRIYSIFFTTQQEGFAVSKNNELFVSTNAGNTWNLKETNSRISVPVNNDYLWSSEIYCSAMQTKDGGNTWFPYSPQMQEHFCRVYLKDPNVDYKTASEFLNTVTSKILLCITNEDITSIANKPQQCAEYYTNENEGWALGWCLRNFKMNKILKTIK
jgi:hypothetical protein